MQIVTYRRADGIIHWIGDSGSPDYMGPILRDTLVQTIVPIPQKLEKWYEGWHVYQGGVIVVAVNEPEDRRGILHWRSKLITLNMLNAAISAIRHNLLTPVFGQDLIEHWRAGSMVLTQQYAEQKQIGLAEAQSMVVMANTQMMAVLEKTEAKRMAFESEIVAAPDYTAIQSIRMRINQYLGG